MLQGDQTNKSSDVQKRRQSKYGFDLVGVNMEKVKLEKTEMNAFIANFKRIEKTIISFNEFLTLSKKLQYDTSAKSKEFVLKEMEARGIRKLDLESSLVLISQLKEFLQKMESENDVNSFSEYVDVFVALGGNPDQSGIVAKSTILEIIQKEFELTIDIEIFLEKIESGGEQLDFTAFCQLFEIGNSDKRTLTKSSSVLSLLSNRSKRSIKSNKSMKVKYSDFEKFYEQMEQQDKEKFNIQESP